jgi:hypothetical protein
MSFREIIAVNSENHAEYSNVFYEEKGLSAYSVP